MARNGTRSHLLLGGGRKCRVGEKYVDVSTVSRP